MYRGKFLAVVFAVFMSSLAVSPAQVSVDIGVAPVCPYGYFDYAPYNCAPYGYYGPDWFVGGVFLGAGPWFRGPSGFHGHVDNRFDPHHGYNGPFPERNERAFNHFHPNEARDGEAMWARRVMIRDVNTRLDLQATAGMVAADTAIADL